MNGKLWQHLLFWLFILLAGTLSILPLLRINYISVDLAETLYHVQELHNGRVPFRDIFSHHFLGYLVPFYLLQFFVPLNPPVVWALCILFNFLTAYILFLCVLELTNDKPTAYLAAFLMATIGWFWGWAGPTFNNQAYILPLLSAYFLFLLRACGDDTASAFFRAALLFGMLLVYDQRLLGFAVLLLVPLVAGTVSDDIYTKVKALASAFAAPCVCLLYLAYNGALYDLYLQTLVFPLQHRNLGVSLGVLGAAKYLIIRAWQEEWPALSLAGLGLLSLARGDLKRPIKALFFLSVVCCALYVFSGGRRYTHYLYIFGPFTVLLISFLYYSVKSCSSSAARIAGFLILLAALSSPLRLYRYPLAHGRLFLSGDEETVLAAAAKVKSLTSEADSVLVWGYAPQIYLLSGRLSPFRDVGLLSIGGANFSSTDPAKQGIVAEMTGEFETVLRNTPPKVIISYFTSPSACGRPDKVCPQLNMDWKSLEHFAYFREFVAENYTMIEKIENALDGAEVYLRR